LPARPVARTLERLEERVSTGAGGSRGKRGERDEREDEEREPTDEPSGHDSERPTVVPPFNVEDLARKSADSGRADARAPTASLTMATPQKIPIPATPSNVGSEPLTGRSNVLAMANANSPSIAPPSLTKPVVLEEGISALDRAWGEDEADEPAAEAGPRAAAPSAAPAESATPPPAVALSDEPFSDEARYEVDVPPPPAASLPPALAAPPPPIESAPPTPGSRVTTLRPSDDPDLPPVLGGAAVDSGPPSPSPLSQPGSGPNRRPTMPAPTEVDAEREMRDRFSLGDYTGALASAESILAREREGARHAEALAFAENCRTVLRQMYTARIGPLDRVPMVMVPAEQLRWLSIDHKAGFVLSHIDGVSSLEMILDVSGMPALEALRILCELAQQRIISFR
jgi:hypothetical protein